MIQSSPTQLVARTFAQGMTLYQSPLFLEREIPHAFTTRKGGVSAPPCDSLSFQPAATDVSYLRDDPTPATPGTTRSTAPGHDQHAAALANFARLKAALKCDDRRAICLWQVHGDTVIEFPPAPPVAARIPAEPMRDADPLILAKGDALLTADPAALLLVRVADCVPVLLATDDGRAVAAIHAGWRGVVAGVVPAAARQLAERAATEPATLIAAIGPCISPAHFEVGDEVVDAFEEAGLGDCVLRDGFAKPHIDLPAAIARQLESLGVSSARIDRTDRCTYRDAAEFFSHRRDHGRTGRMATAIGVAVK